MGREEDTKMGKVDRSKPSICARGQKKRDQETKSERSKQKQKQIGRSERPSSMMLMLMMQMSPRLQPLLRPTNISLAHRLLRIHTQRQTAATDLLRIPLTRHGALGILEHVAADQLVPAEALAAVLGAGEAEAARVAVGDALGVGDGVLADVGKLDAREHARVAVVAEAAFVVEPADHG